MPTNRTKRTRTRADLDEHKLGQLLNGPHDCLLAGLGYHCRETKQFYWDASEAGQAVILDEMRADWLAHRETVLAAADAEPWALTEFGDPR